MGEVTKNHSPVDEFPQTPQRDRRARLDALTVLAESDDAASAQIAFLQDAYEIVRYLRMIRRFDIN
jgi:hypothetical protein